MSDAEQAEAKGSFLIDREDAPNLATVFGPLVSVMGPFNGYFLVHFACESSRVSHEKATPVKNSDGTINQDEDGFTEMTIGVPQDAIRPVRETTARILIPANEIESIARAFSQAAEGYRKDNPVSTGSK